MTEHGVAALDDDGLFELMYKRFESKQWWIIISDPDNAKLSATIEQQYYSPGTEANEDFHLAFDLFVFMVMFAKKSHMSKTQLMDITAKLNPDYIHVLAFRRKDTREEDKNMLVIPSSVEHYRGLVPFLTRLDSYFQRRELV